ncbi:MAG: alpha-keto acid decarboxylase family protein [Gammaproteobacteria bacterium]|nr:alpha-keto acid decarboxylase family protein [Gammaproteobacteria bacterium]
MAIKQISIADYLLQRLKELGIDEIFGVPGDYNLALLDKVVASDGLEWVGNCNELNASYAADGYARVNGTAALITTFGVGELSAINGIAGSFAEYLPVINIVGWPATTVEKAGMLMHHTLGTGDFGVFLEMFKKVSAAVAILDTPEHAARELDKALEIGWIKKQPVYIGLPSNHIDVLIDAPQNKLHLAYPKSNQKVVDELAERAASLICAAKAPVVLADLCAVRHPMKDSIKTLLSNTGLPLATMNMAKGIFDESHPYFLGGYKGDYSTPGVQARIEGADCILAFGSMLSDFNTGGFTCHLDASATIEIHSNYVKIKHALYPDVYFDAVIPALIKALGKYQHTEQITPLKMPEYKPSPELLTQQRFWDRMANYFKPQDIILAETGTSMFGLLDAPILHPVTVITQPLWASIGYTVGGLLGAALADRKRRSILFIGDGSFQLTAQEVSTMLRHKLTPIIFLLNNDGYTIERVIHGMKMPYNDVQPWNYAALPNIFGEAVFSSIVKTEDELEDVLLACETHQDKLCFIELKLTREDCPETLRKLGEACDAKNKG